MAQAYKLNSCLFIVKNIYLYARQAMDLISIAQQNGNVSLEMYNAAVQQGPVTPPAMSGMLLHLFASCRSSTYESTKG